MLSDKLKKMDPALKDTLKVVLQTGAKVNNIEEEVEELEQRVRTAEDNTAKAKEDLKAKSFAPLVLNIDKSLSKIPTAGEFPEGNMVTKKAAEVFGFTELDFDIPFWEWKTPHPLVPKIEEGYEFNVGHLRSILYALVFNIPQWLVGHTGTGKTTHVLQILARMNWPCIRANFDSELTRMEVIGKETLITDASGNTVTKFSETILPMAMRHGFVFLGDEWDCIRPDVAYVFQPVLEGGNLVIMEDNARVVERHPMFRIVATGNTKGQGDESGIYNGTRPQSGASMDRFPVMIEFDYMTKKEVGSILSKKFESVDEDVVENLTKFAHEYWIAFQNAQLTTPLTLRGLENVLEMYRFFRSSGMAKKDSIRVSVLNTCVSKANKVENQVINGLTDRTVLSGGVK